MTHAALLFETKLCISPLLMLCTAVLSMPWKTHDGLYHRCTSRPCEICKGLFALSRIPSLSGVLSAKWAKDVCKRSLLVRDDSENVMIWGHRMGHFFVFRKVREGPCLDKSHFIVNPSISLEFTDDQYFRRKDSWIFDLLDMGVATGPVPSNHTDCLVGSSEKS